MYGCEYYQFCTYEARNYTGMVDRMSSCVLHRSHSPFTSYVNNQTRGTRARFFSPWVTPLTYTEPAPYVGTTSYGYAAFYIRPC